MHLFDGTHRRWFADSVAAVLLLIAAGPAPAAVTSTPSVSSTLTESPLAIAKQGSFYVGGSTIRGFPTGDYTVNQMYVEYQIPLLRKPGAYPIIMVHGSSHTGKAYDETPDGREGWRTYFLRRGYPVYVVDQAGYARSSFNASALRDAIASNDKTQVPKITGFSNDRAWTDFRIGPTPYTPFAQSQFPVENKDQYFAQLVPNTETTLQETDGTSTTDDLGLLIEKIGPAVVMVHSQSGKFGWRVAMNKFPLVKAVVAIEPLGGCNATDTEIATAFKAVSSLAILGDHPEGNAPFTNVIITTCTVFMQKINAAGGHGTFLQTPKAGFHGNSHLMMLEKNNLQIADWIINWLDQNVE